MGDGQWILRKKQIVRTWLETPRVQAGREAGAALTAEKDLEG
jgi:hypothetical protein